jgi:hypothetical protein
MAQDVPMLGASQDVDEVLRMKLALFAYIRMAKADLLNLAALEAL